MNGLTHIVKESKARMNYESFSVWSFGIAVVISSNYMQWNQGLASGFCSFFLATCITGTAFIGFVLCFAESFNALPFSGGSYGVVRCAVGFFPGYLVGCFETSAYLLNTSFAVSTLSQDLVHSHGASLDCVPWIALLIYLVSGVTIYCSKTMFWKVNIVLALFSGVVTLIYLFGSLKYANFQTNVIEENVLFIGGMFSFFTNALPISSFFFGGTESLTFSRIENPKANIPNGSVASIITLCVISLSVIVIGSSSPPGVEALSNLTTTLPFNLGFSQIFNCSTLVGSYFSIPAQIGTIFGFVFCYGNLVCALASSGLFPKFLAARSQTNDAPFLAVLFVSIISYIVFLWGFYSSYWALVFNNLVAFSQYSTYIGHCIGYIFFKKRFSSIDCVFKSPFGIYGAIYSCLVFTVCFIALAGFQDDNFGSICSYFTVYGGFSVYYFAHAQFHQHFSAEEQKYTLVGYVVKFNNNKRSKAKNHRNTAIKRLKPTFIQVSKFKCNDQKSNKVAIITPTNANVSCSAVLQSRWSQ